MALSSEPGLHQAQRDGAEQRALGQLVISEQAEKSACSPGLMVALGNFMSRYQYLAVSATLPPVVRVCSQCSGQGSLAFLHPIELLQGR